VEVKLHPEVNAKVKIWIVSAEGESTPEAIETSEAIKKPQKAPKKK
jgi:hypothetical protein